MATSNNGGNLLVPEQLYHTLLYYVDGQTSGAPFPAFPLATHTDLKVAKEFAQLALQKLGYSVDDFEHFDVHDAESNHWSHGDGAIVWAKAANGSEIEVIIDTTPNNEQLLGGPDYKLQLPKGSDRLHYVVQTTIDLNKDRSGAAQRSEIEGVYAHRSTAILAAKQQLAELVANGEFAQYSERSDLQEGKGKEWPYGEDVIVHAIAQTGENYYIAVKTVPEARIWHGIGKSS